MQTSHQAKIFESMMQADFYPHRTESVQRCETHISTVFLTGPFVYKIKKPVDLGFLDFTTLEKRRYYCRQEIVLNRRLSRGVYIDVVPITRQKDRYALNGPGETVEVAVKMRQLAAADAMQARLRHAPLEEGQIDALVDRLVHFYARAETDWATGPPDSLAWEENLRETAAFAGVWIDRPKFECVRSAAHAFYRHRQPLFQRRRQDGKIKDCHGDLRTDHIYFAEDGIQIIDCIEFNRRLRLLDPISDLAFLAMDITYHHRPEMATRLIQSYVEQTEDVGALPLLDFYRCYRAMVRCKVNCLLLRQTGDRTADARIQAAAVRYLDMAHGYAVAFNRPILWVVYGLPASGKSTLAGMLGRLFDMDVIRSDIVRKSLFGESPDASTPAAYGKGMYSICATGVTYERMFALADEKLKKGRSVVLDATFSRTFQRDLARRLAARRQAMPVFVMCRAAEPILKTRLARRETEPSVSDARLIHLDAFKNRFAAMDRAGDESHIVVDTANPPAVCLRQIVLSDFLSAGC